MLMNLTGHPLNFPSLGTIIEPESFVAKVQQEHTLIAMHGEIPLFDISYPSITGLPEPKKGVLYVVSAPVLNAVREMYPERTDVAATFKPIKSAVNGKTIGCSALRLRG